MDRDPDGQEWAIAVSTNERNGRQIIYRYVQHVSSTLNRASQPDRIIIVWKYQSDGGQPTVEDHQRMTLLEDSLASALEEDQFATLALVTTGENLREWTYYAKSEEEFLSRLNLALYGMPAFPIEIHTASDPTWSDYSQFMARVKETVN